MKHTSIQPLLGGSPVADRKPSARKPEPWRMSEYFDNEPPLHPMHPRRMAGGRVRDLSPGTGLLMMLMRLFRLLR